ncbi:uncharacterized protein LOC115877200 [Sitophilus oryzae]|uniref:Uncharacterized protein LOC115877200 n=1 Tax=Sitophilus oryzae TaxID=7048 RepID=A0A6J2XDK2_SITOR|nr:uncharacterized protein LOC115877200 [Sitophilus oryzae]
MYYKYSNVQTLKEECHNLLSDSNKDVTIPLEEEVEQEVFTKNTTICTKLHECYFKPLASSHSEYCFDLRKKANSEQCHRYNHVKYESIAKDSKISTIKSKSDVLLTISHEKTLYFFFKTVLDSLKRIEKSCKYNKECQVSDIKLTEVSLTDEKLEELEEIYHADIKYPDFKTNDPKEVYDVFGSSSKSNVTQEVTDSKKNKDPCERWAAEKIDVAVGSRSRITKNTVTKEVAVEAKLKTSIPLIRPQKRVKQLKSVAISPIYITDQTEMKEAYQVEAPKLKVCTPRSPVRKQTQQKSRERSSNKKSPPRTLNNNFELTCPQTVLTVEKHEIFVNNNDNMDQILKNKLRKAKTPLKDRLTRKTKDKVMKDHNVPTDTCLNACFPHSPRTPKTPNKKEGIVSRFGAITKPLAVLPVIWKQKKGELKEVNVSSTSSSLSDTLENVKRSQSLNDIIKKREESTRSKTTCGTKRGLKEFHDTCGSFISNNIEKFTNKPTVNRSQGLENDIENKLTGRLFLTKDYKTGEISSYQRRKLYDQSIRKRMKRKFKLSRMEMTPQVFEVRFLSMINQDNLLKERKRPISPIFHKKDNCVVKKSDKLDRGDNNREEDVEQSKEAVEAVKDEESSVTKIYFNKELKEQEALVELCKKLLKLNKTNELQAVLNGNKCFCSSFTQNCNGCHEFMSFLDLLHSSMSNYCTSSGLEKTNKEEKPGICSGGKFGEVFPGNFGCNRSLSCQSFGISEQNNCLIQPISCPMLFDNSTSFDYLYEHSSDSNKSETSEKFLQSFTKVEHNFDMDMNQYNVENSCFYMSKSTTESGYSSIKSKQNSCSSFFKKCKIITMLKSKKSSELNVVTDLQSDCYRKIVFFLNIIMLANDYFLASSENEDDFLLVQFDKNNFVLENNCKLVFNNQALNLDVFMYLESDVCGKIHQKAEQKFINMIMQAYDKEFALCQSFLKNGEFLETVLVPAVISQKRTTIKKARSEKFKSFFTRKSNESCMESKILMTLDEMRVKEMVEKLALGAKKDFAMLAAAVKSNGNIDDGIKICGLLMLLERLCSGHFDLLQIDLNCDSAIEIEKEITDLFVKVFILSEKEAKNAKGRLGIEK